MARYWIDSYSFDPSLDLGAMAPRFPLFLPTIVRSTQVLAAYYLFTNHVVGVQYCVGFSMLPTLPHDGVLLLHSPIPYWAPFFRSPPRRGDLIVASSPNDPDVEICKRVIGVAGDVIEVDCRRDAGRSSRERWVGEEDTAYDDGESGEGKKVERWMDSEGRRLAKKRKGQNQWVRIPKGYVWLQGDNMSNSTDSRMYGPVPLAMVKGKVLAQVTPSWKWLNNPVKPL